MQRIGVVAFAADVGVGAAFEEQLYCSFAVAEDGVVQCCSHALPAALVNQLRMRVKERIEAREVASSSGIAKEATASAVELAASSVLT